MIEEVTPNREESKDVETVPTAPNSSRIAKARLIKELQEDQWHEQWVVKNAERQKTMASGAAS